MGVLSLRFTTYCAPTTVEGVSTTSSWVLAWHILDARLIIEPQSPSSSEDSVDEEELERSASGGDDSPSEEEEAGREVSDKF